MRPEARQAILHRRRDLGGHRHVDGAGGAGVALGLDDCLRLGDRRRVQVDAVDLGALAGQQHRGRAAVAPALADRARAGDKGDLSGQVQHVLLRYWAA